MAAERAVPSDLFPLVLAFLRENHFDGAARAFGKAAGATEQDPNAASLLDIFNYWLKSPIAKKQQAFANGSPVKKTKKESSRYKTSSENEIPPVKKQAAKPVTVYPVPIKATSGSSESSSADNTDSTDSEQEEKKPAKKRIALQSTIQKTKSQKTSKSSSSDSSSSEDETPKYQPPKSEGAQKVIKLASTSAKPTKVMSKTTNGKAESSSSSDESSSSEDSSSEENQPVKGKLKKLPHYKNNTAQPLPVKSKHVKKSNSETCDSSEHENLASKPKRGEYSAVPPPLAIESRKGKAHLIKKTFKKKGENNEKKEQVFTKRPSTEGSVIKKAFSPKSLPVSIQKGNTSSGSDSDSSSEEEKKVLVKCSAKAVSANGATKSVPSKKVSSSSDTSDSDCSHSIPEKFAVRTGIKKVKKPLGVLAKKVESSFEDKKVHKIKSTKAVKTTPKSSTPVSKPKSSESSSSSSEEQTQPSQKATSKLSVGSNLIISKQAPAEIRTSSENSTDEFKISEKTERKRGQNNCKTAKKVLKTSANFVGKTSASKTPTSEVLNSTNSSSSDEEATKEGLSKKKRKRKDELELETPDIKKMKARSPHTFPKSKRQSSPFRRIRTEEIEIDVRVANNSFDAKKGAVGDWGEKANDVLKFTKGKSFRHEKTKKKRGSYCGGTISTQINSIKFESD
ncbi:nucleolar and coiled-body phosphoprotein 1 isoform X1 [Pantherophis guttatus]|uniref:Nucleolar and coiled-body phosphoprotein 1 isoform X1 n=1 Tax=Pantherophis guttatus TaxID=94885 RepID=A0A6P9D670_PANGU|nr:nucleolar and coiled-body phosphoprotein 1 isoform X1 [Pantherophis guttatus]